jgi:hypothetical protein
MTLSLGLHFMSPFLVMRLPWRYFASVGAVPIYLWWKLCILLVAQPDRWIRTPRETLGNAVPSSDGAP